MSEAPENVTEWCAGLPLVGQRPMQEADRESVLREAHRLLWKGAGIVVLFPLLMLLLGNVVPRIVDELDVWLLECFILLVFCLPIQVFLASQAFRRSWRLRRDAEHGFIKRYAGVLKYPPTGDVLFRQLTKSGLLPAVPNEDWEWEVLPHSRRVWRVKEAAVSRWIDAPSTLVAVTPTFAALASEWLQPVYKTLQSSVSVGGREMGPSETEELCRYVRRMWKRRLLSSAIVTVYLDFLLTRTLVMLPHERLGPNDLGYTRGFTAFVILCNAGYFLLVGLSLKLHRDANSRRVLIRRDAFMIRRPDSESQKEHGDDKVEVSRIIEWLPISRRIWTIDGHPAPWRMSQKVDGE